MQQYTSKSGRKLWKPSIEAVEEMDNNCEGFCIACGETQGGVEPDARRYECESCGEHMVFGGAELALMGLVH